MNGRRRALVAMVACALPRAAHGQSPSTVVRVGFLRIVAPPRQYIEAFEQGLRERGYTPGRNVAIDYRFAQGREDELERHARDLVAREVTILVVAGNQAIHAARRATRTLPIVMAVGNDPVASGFVASLGRPGGNITGTTIISSTLVAKRLELVRELLPNARNVAFLLNADNTTHEHQLAEAKAAGQRLGLDVSAYAVRGSDAFPAAFARMAVAREEVLVLAEDAFFVSERVKLAALAQQARLPAVYGQRTSVEDGGLISYGPSIEDAYRNAGAYVERILKGARPAELPIDQPSRFELVVNVRTANALGLAVPRTLLLRADGLIQ